MMKAKLYVVILIGCCLIVAGCKSISVISSNHPSNPYLDRIKKIMKTEWPKNRTINLVFHGHSVPSGYFKTPDVKTFDAYPLLTLKKVKDLYPYAVVNAITTSIGGDNSVAGAKPPNSFMFSRVLANSGAVFIWSPDGPPFMPAKSPDKPLILKCLTPPLILSNV